MARKPFTPAEQMAIAAAVTLIVGTFNRANARQLAKGRGWYNAARAFAAALIPGDMHRAAGIIAGLSPMTGWDQNVRQARQVVAAWRSGDACPDVQTGPNRAKVWAIAHGADPLGTLSGPKVTRFYRAITGDHSVVTVDRWAARVAGFDVDAVSPRLYAICEAAYWEAAAVLGESPSDVQAVTWVVAREDAGYIDTDSMAAAA